MQIKVQQLKIIIFGPRPCNRDRESLNNSLPPALYGQPLSRRFYHLPITCRAAKPSAQKKLRSCQAVVQREREREREREIERERSLRKEERKVETSARTLQETLAL